MSGSIDQAMANLEAAAKRVPPAPQAPVIRPLVAALSYDGGSGELFRLWLKTTALTILTLGFYRFWGRTRIRRYLWSRLALTGDRFEYDGTGGELFVRFLAAVLVILLPLAAIGYGLEISGWPPALVGALKGLEFLVIAYLSFVGHYTGQRYRLSRSLWRGIRGGLEGSAINYGFRALGFATLRGPTLGLIKPWEYVGLWRYEARHTRLGGQRLVFTGRGRDLFGSWLRTFLIVVFGGLGLLLLLLGVIAVAGGIIALAMQRSGVDLGSALPTLGAIGIGTYVIVLAILWLFWIAVTSGFERNWLVYSAEGTALGGLRFALEARKSEVRRLRIGNYLLTLLTLGLGWPFVAQRTLRFYARTVRLDAEQAELLSQTELPSRPPASGIAEIFDTAGFA